jgi:hypothetical protein
VIYSATCFLGLNQHNYPDSGSNLLELVFQPDDFHSPFTIDCTMPVRRSKQNCNFSYKRFSAGDYALLYNALCNYDWSSLNSSSCYGNSFSLNQSAEILQLAPILNSHVQNAIKRLRPSKSIDSTEYRVLS